MRVSCIYMSSQNPADDLATTIFGVFSFRSGMFVSIDEGKRIISRLVRHWGRAGCSLEKPLDPVHHVQGR